MSESSYVGKVVSEGLSLTESVGVEFPSSGGLVLFVGIRQLTL